MNSDRKFLTALDNYPLYAGDKVYDIKNKKIFTVADIRLEIGQLIDYHMVKFST